MCSITSAGEPIRADGAISVRELARSVSRVLDAVERDDAVFAIGRYGRVVAVLAPVPERLVIEVAGTPAKPVEEVIPPDDSIPAWLEEDPLARAILVGGVANPQRRIDINAVAGTPRDIALAAGHLDRDHLIDKDLGGWKLTRAGVDVAQVIMRRGLDITEPARTSWGRIVD